MTGLPYVVRDRAGDVKARCKHTEDAAAIVALHGRYATIKVGNRTYWTEDVDGIAGDSYDGVAALIHDRERRTG